MIRLKGVVALLFFFCIASCSMAQEIQRSTQIEFIGGKNCYLHTVMPGQTLPAIAKAYQVGEEDILQLNPDARRGIRVNMILRVPVKTPAAKSVHVVHTVVQGETLSGIADDYKVKLSEIYNLNPGLSPNIKPGQKIMLPQMEKVPETPAKGTSQLHIVQKNETLFGIARQYETTVDELKKMNPGLNETIQIGQQIRVPAKSTVVQLPEKPKDTVIFECMKTGLQSSYNIGLLVPFYLSRAYGIDTSKIDKNSKKFDSFTFLGFYEGFCIALDSLERSGLSVKVLVDDVAEDTGNIIDILNKPAYSGVNLLIGPFYSRNFAIAADWARKKQVKIINPFSSNSEFVNGNPFVIKNVASYEQEATRTVEYIHKTWTDCNIFLVYSGFERDTSLLEEYRKILLPQDKDSKGFFEVNYTREGLAGITKDMTDDKPNIVISLINSEVAVSNYIRGMSVVSFAHPLVVFGSKKWEDYSSLEPEYLLNIKLHIVASSFIDYQQADVKDFVLKYRERYKTEPDAYAFAGFDNAMYYLNALHLYGVNFQNCLNKYHPQLLQTELEFRHMEGGGFENSKVCIYRYENFKLIDAYTNPLTTILVNKKEK